MILENTKKKSKKHPLHGRTVNIERGCQMNGERGTYVKYSFQHDNIHIVNRLCIDKQKWLQVQVKIVGTCHATGFQCLCCISFHLKTERRKASRVISKCCLYLHNSHHYFINMYIYTHMHKYNYAHPYTYIYIYIYIYIIYIYTPYIHIYIYIFSGKK